MKKILLTFAACLTFILSSCEGPQGPPGPPGINILGQVYEVNIDFTAGNNYSQIVTFPNDIIVYESDVVLIYWLEEVSGTLDVWSPLPQTIYFNDGSFQYTFNHTFVDANIFLQGDIDLSTLGNGFTRDQVFRIAIVPSEFATDSMSMDELLEGLQMDSTQIESISL